MRGALGTVNASISEPPQVSPETFGSSTPDSIAWVSTGWVLEGVCDPVCERGGEGAGGVCRWPLALRGIWLFWVTARARAEYAARRRDVVETPFGRVGAFDEV